ncbi:LacI family DNA-binding transcriptional regulator [Streptomonospora nanhaiensis]|uniref:LacI family DNA-binding transcriptional regulator n=1 Tax=Streptomonospora nanhaiensis TaxID=1323731 RepID=A0ABY6YW48_9ACTN|nr:LacI family DNA-binding transcriptional regulator [Streptomonospora nanhaiensis]WAE76100.1 LacI family DNA-binding transcriptional regulator [Streptomonospora nanhaiensis]
MSTRPRSTRPSVGITEVARHAGVSPGTVSNVLNRPERVAEATRARVEAAIAELDYVRNSSGSSLRSGRSGSVGLLVLDVTNPFFTEVARGVEDEAAGAGLAVVLLNSAEAQDRQRRNVRLLAEQRAAGAVVMPVDDDLSDLLWLSHQGTSWVALDRGDVAEDVGCSVSVDNHAGGLAAGRHLIGLGHERVTFLTGPFAIEQVRRRHQGLLDAFTESGMDPGAHVRVVEQPLLNPQQGERAVDAVLAGGPRQRPQAVFCANDQLALGLMKGLGRRGLRVPDDISVVGYDNVDLADLVHPGLTTVAQPKYDLGRAAMRLLRSELDDPGHRHERVLFTPELVVRGSTAAYRS